MIDVTPLLLGSFFQANCYLAVNENREAFAVDIGGDADILIRRLERDCITLKKILLTHGHYDHIRGVALAAEKTGAEVFIHEEDKVMLTSEGASLARFVGTDQFTPVEKFNVVKDGDIISFGETEIKVLHTPGHTKGSVCFIADDMIFSGDTLFCSSIGRTDFPGGSFRDLSDAIHTKLFVLPDETQVLPGHMGLTSIGFEKENNPFV